jgi:hypothetical protein
MLSASIRALYGMFLRWYPLDTNDSVEGIKGMVRLRPQIDPAPDLKVLAFMDEPLSAF